MPDSTIDIIKTRTEWRYFPVVVAAPAVVAAAADRPSNRKSLPVLLGNGVSRIGCAKALQADSLGSEYYRDRRDL